MFYPVTELLMSLKSDELHRNLLEDKYPCGMVARFLTGPTNPNRKTFIPSNEVVYNRVSEVNNRMA